MQAQNALCKKRKWTGIFIIEAQTPVYGKILLCFLKKLPLPLKTVQAQKKALPHLTLGFLNSGSLR